MSRDDRELSEDQRVTSELSNISESNNPKIVKPSRKRAKSAPPRKTPTTPLSTQQSSTNAFTQVRSKPIPSTLPVTRKQLPSPSVVSHSPTVRTDSTPRDQASTLSHLENAFEMRAMQPPPSSTHESSHLSPSYDAHLSNSDTSKPSLSTQSSHVFKPEEISSIQQNIRAKGCIVTFNSNGTADKITGPNPVEAVQHCGNPIFKQGPFSLNFNVDLQNPALVQKMKEKVNALLQSARDSNIPIQKITINGSESGALQLTRDPTTNTITGINIDTNQSPRVSSNLTARQ